MRIGGKKEIESRLYSFDELKQKVETDIKEFLANLEYWDYKPELNVMRHRRMNYDVDFNEITDDASLCDWIMHIYNRQWMEEDAVLEFLDFASIYRNNSQKNYDPENVKKYLK
jgi:hypothetical protein